MKLDDLLATVSETLRENGVQLPVIQRVVKEVQAAAEEEKQAKEPKAPRVKLQTVILAPTPEAGGQIEAAWAIQMEVDAPAGAVIDRLKEGALAFNRTRAGQRNPVRTLGEAMEVLKPKHLKDEAHPERKTKVVTPTLIQVIQVGPQDAVV